MGERHTNAFFWGLRYILEITMVRVGSLSLFPLSFSVRALVTAPSVRVLILHFGTKFPNRFADFEKFFP